MKCSNFHADLICENFLNMLQFPLASHDLSVCTFHVLKCKQYEKHNRRFLCGEREKSSPHSLQHKRIKMLSRVAEKRKKREEKW
jgi:hypothetical protein